MAFWVGLAAFALMAVLGLTPLVWQVQGRPSESYPELVFLGIGLPLGVISLTAGALLAWNSASRTASNVSGLRLMSLLSLLGCGGLLGLTFAPPDLVSFAFAELMLNAFFVGAPLLGLATVILATGPLIKRRARVS
ncbi:hypothetical protein DDF67_11820 [Caulobacter endophyticus]|uniref:Uncharacterized protein n=1 Tax=Caulobacter endophyticus TaxID=2172652 RepID=A0A2T9K1A7_9CAUL|nr:hypothetical protein DDF67_11820 [Caulobacter endophyticus]